MKIVFVLALVGAGVTAERFSQAENREWSSFKETYGKHYDTSEIESLRKFIFFQNKKAIEAHNKRFENGETTYSLGMNKFGDMLAIEVAQKLNGLTIPAINETEFESFDHIDKKSLPEHVDWRTKHIVTPIKNQEECGGCWAFSATGALEGQHALKYKRLVSLSEQNLIDCSSKEGNLGCDGGWPSWAFKYIKVNKGIDTEKSYPFTGEDGTCHYSRKHDAATDNGFKAIKTGNEIDLKKAVARVGPISVCIDASSLDFQLYSSGIFAPTGCSRTSLDHAVLAVGYGVDNGKDYWLVKNSWGTDWGLKGYIWMARNDDNMCGIATKATYPTL